jgi:hypothetical protein
MFTEETWSERGVSSFGERAGRSSRKSKQRITFLLSTSRAYSQESYACKALQSAVVVGVLPHVGVCDIMYWSYYCNPSRADPGWDVDVVRPGRKERQKSFPKHGEAIEKVRRAGNWGAWGSVIASCWTSQPEANRCGSGPPDSSLHSFVHGPICSIMPGVTCPQLCLFRTLSTLNAHPHAQMHSLVGWMCTVLMRSRHSIAALLPGKSVTLVSESPFDYCSSED